MSSVITKKASRMSVSTVNNNNRASNCSNPSVKDKWLFNQMSKVVITDYQHDYQISPSIHVAHPDDNLTDF